MAASLAACGVKKTDESDNPAAATPAPAETTATENPTAATPPPAANPVQAIQSQPGPFGSTVVLERAAVTGNILTVQLRVTGGTRDARSVKIEDISVIDDATSNRIGVLKDNEGKWMASDPGSGLSLIRTGREGGEVLWFKFPAPPATSATISINIPDVAPFDGVPVTR